MNILIVGGAAPATWPALTEEFDYYIGVDRGGLYLMSREMPLDLSVGDFDSLSEAERQQVFQYATEVRQSPAEKDDTDTQLALKYALEKEPKAKITIIGVTGGRLDHFLSNLWLVLEPRFQPHSQQIVLKDYQNTIRYLLPGTHTIKREPKMKYLAYCCLTPVEKLTLTESKYTLASYDALVPTSFASNEFMTNQATISFTSGIVAVIQSRDAKEKVK